MNNKVIAFISVFIILIFIVFMIWDTATFRDNKQSEETEQPIVEPLQPIDQWVVSDVLDYTDGTLKAVAVTGTGDLYIGGDSFIACYDSNLNRIWNIKTPDIITSMSFNSNILYASTRETILLVNTKGEIIEEWGPYEKDPVITSVSSNDDYVAFADAANKRIFILKKNGEVIYMVGQAGDKFIIPSPYFDVALAGGNTLIVANTGNHRVETWTFDGRLIDYFGTPGLAPEAFCGCCNPAHFYLTPEGLITAEKGINRIKILKPTGEFVEFVSSKNDFVASAPLDIASQDGKTIYGANSADSKLYIFTRK